MAKERFDGWVSQQVVVDGVRVHVRRTETHGDGVPIVHVHGFGISRRYLMPTAQLLAARSAQYVPDLPGYGRSGDPSAPLAIPELAHALIGTVDRLGLDRAVLLGNSMGCPISLEAVLTAPDRFERIVLVAPAGGIQNQPFRRGAGQLALDGVRERPAMAKVAVPDYLRFGPLNALKLFQQLVAFPSLEKLLACPIPLLAVLGDRDPLMPGRARVEEVASKIADHSTVVVIEGAAHALNFSHPGELAHVVGQWLDGEEITDDPDQPGLAKVLPIPRG